jgi:phosphoribosylglycinamide formyltransferase-1
MIRIAVFASGSGSNAENLINYFKQSELAKIQLILTNNPNAGVIERAKRLKINCEIFSRDQFSNGEPILKRLSDERIDFIVLAGFLLLVSEIIIDKYKDKMINVHPALLPLHGGKGFYGSHVHKAVKESGSIISGITIHKVNNKFDEGEIIFQAACHVDKNETEESLAQKIHAMEYKYFPIVIEKLISN